MLIYLINLKPQLLNIMIDKLKYLFAYSVPLFFSTLAVAGSREDAEGIMDIIMVKINTYQDLIVIAAFAIGAIMLLNAISSIKKLSEANSQEEPGDVAVKFIVAFILFSFGFFMTSIGASF